jgi:small subunit ribosomal protein S27Ae
MAEKETEKPKAAKPAQKGAAKGGAKGSKKVQKKYEKYEVIGDTVKRKNKMCPKCGPGIFLAEHKDRWACGKCGYMEKRS